MSTLVKEDNEFLYLVRYLHNEPDAFSEWERDGFAYPEIVHQAEHYAFLEIRAHYRIRKSDGQVFYDRFD
jgi:hypothetical protein